MKDVQKNRKATVITLGEDIRAMIPRCMDNLYKIEEVAVTDGEDLSKDETFRLYGIRTVLVEGTSVVDNGRAVNINGDFDIPLMKSEDDKEDQDLVNNVYYTKEEAVVAWEILTNAQLDKVIKERDRLIEVAGTIQRSKDERQF